MTPEPARLEAFRQASGQWGAPVIVFNKSHSGSRVLAELLASAGVFMGAHLNESWDSLDALEIVEYLVRAYYPNYTPVWHSPAAAAATAEVAARVFARHLQGFSPACGARWGWKLCETGYAIPVLDACFSGARYIHLIRDGRDVACCDHRAPDDPFWKKVYFNTDRIMTFRRLRLTPQAYRRRPEVFNAIHWVNSVTMGRAFGAMLRDRYLEVRYEDLCLDFEGTARRVLSFAGVADAERAIATMARKIHSGSVGKHRLRPIRRQRQVLSIVKPLLLSLGYLDADDELPQSSLWHSRRVDNLLDAVRKRRQRRARTPR
jgi:hypothetical protein